jgi:protein tyrosine/serine phosphatase
MGHWLLYAFLVGTFALLLVMGGLGCVRQDAVTHGIKNYSALTDSILRGAQPTTDEGWRFLLTQGVTDIVKLNMPGEGSDDGGAALGMVVHQLGIQPEADTDVLDQVLNTFRRPDPARIEAALTLMRMATPKQKVFVHCTHAWDRTNLVTGLFLHRVKGQTKAVAYQDMIDHGFHGPGGSQPTLHGLHEVWEEEP